MEGQYSSKLLDDAVGQFAKLPGIGRKTALRLVLHLLREQKEEVSLFTEAIRAVRNDIHYCSVCHNISDTDTCDICTNPQRDHSTVCVVENVRDVMAVEATRQYAGVYHVLGGVISPMDGIGPDDLNIESLEERAAAGKVGEVILALSATMEGDTTNFYIYKRLAPYGVKLTTIARGIAVGDELEYADEVTLGRSLVNRVPFEQTI
ncbi:MAG: recombination protein RecR [Bacteroidales bacterium]|nr:recombination protein RecR [Bacteroidales bacterium]